MYEVIAGEDPRTLYNGDDLAKAITLYHECVILRQVMNGEGGPVTVWDGEECIREYHPELGEYQTPPRLEILDDSPSVQCV